MTKKGFEFAVFLMAVLLPISLNACDMPVGFHEFAIFAGKDKIYISHYPMFSSIHAYQVVLEVELKNPDSQNHFLKEVVDHPERRYTFSPYRKVEPTANRKKDQDDWVLPDKAKLENEINGDIHYTENQADKTFEYNVVAKVTNVIQNRLLLPTTQRPEKLKYILFGEGTQYFLAHYLTAPPNPGEEVTDFDQIILVEGADPIRGQAVSQTVTVDERPNDKNSRLKPGETVSLTSLDGKKWGVKGSTEIFSHTVATDR